MSEQQKVRIYMHSMPEVGTISYYRLPDGRMVYRPASDEGRIDLTPLEPFVGQDVEIWRDGGLESVDVLGGITEIGNGIKVLVFQPKMAI